MIAIVMSLVLFVTVVCLHRAKAEPCVDSNCAHIEELVTLPHADGCGTAAC